MGVRLSGFCLAATLLAVRGASASCLPPEGRVLWTYPANGAVDVPTNAQLLVSDEAGRTPSLDGKVLPASGEGVFDLGALEPNTTYQVTWPSGFQEVGASLSFTTGAGPSFEPPPGVPEPVAVTRDPAVPSCRLVASQGCFDTGVRAGVGFKPSETPVAWLVESLYCRRDSRRMVWPSECGAPFIQSEDPRVCVRLRATDGVHVSDQTQVICSLPQLPPTVTLATDSSCVGVDFPPSDALTLISKERVTC
jgi:hypothetical protein